MPRDAVWKLRLDQNEAFKYAMQTPPQLYLQALKIIS
jgi:hypothetical protein